MSEAFSEAFSEALTFRVDGVAPSKENYRKKRGEAARRAWTRIKTFEEMIGWRARQAARPGQLAKLFGRRLSVEILLYQQSIDPDNVKLLIDAMRGIVYPDDSKRFIRRLELIVGDEDTEEFEGPTIVVRVALWE